MPASYRDLGPTQMLTATPDQTGNNPGNWTLTATQRELGNLVAQAEVYQISIDGPVGSSFTLYRNTRRWNFVQQGWANTYDPLQPLFVRPGDTLFFYWKAQTSQTPVPTAVLYLRYDTELPENKYPGVA